MKIKFEYKDNCCSFCEHKYRVPDTHYDKDIVAWWKTDKGIIGEPSTISEKEYERYTEHKYGRPMDKEEYSKDHIYDNPDFGGNFLTVDNRIWYACGCPDWDDRASIQINYCPMCGRSLKVVNKLQQIDGDFK